MSDTFLRVCEQRVRDAPKPSTAQAVEASLDSPPADTKHDAWYELGSQFLKLPARATRDGESATAVGTAVHVELIGRLDVGEPPYLALAFEPSTGEVVVCHRVDHTTGFDGYEEVLWAFIEAYIKRLEQRYASDRALYHKPATLTTTDSALADYIFGLLQGCGMDAIHIDARTQRVQWAADDLRTDDGAPSASGQPQSTADAAPFVQDVMERVLADLVDSGRAAAALNGSSGTAQQGVVQPPGRVQLVPIGACHNDSCGRLLSRSKLKRCSACKRMYYCSTACQLQHWRYGGHKEGCKDIQEIHASLHQGASSINHHHLHDDAEEATAA